jgi:hypothetical protein
MVLALLAVILLSVHHRRKTLELIAASKEGMAFLALILHIMQVF